MDSFSQWKYDLVYPVISRLEEINSELLISAMEPNPDEIAELLEMANEYDIICIPKINCINSSLINKINKGLLTNCEINQSKKYINYIEKLREEIKTSKIYVDSCMKRRYGLILEF
jgi:hypothetical protein